MNNTEFEALTEELFIGCIDTMKAKGPDYASSPDDSPEERDRLWNFKEVARRTGSNPYKVWAVYFNKHIVSLEKWVRERELQSEPLEGRIIDAINYLVLFRALLKEGEGEGMTEDMSLETVTAGDGDIVVIPTEEANDRKFQDKLTNFFKSESPKTGFRG